MKKTIAAVAVVVVLGLAGVAVAERHEGKWGGWRDGQGPCRMSRNDDRGALERGRQDGRGDRMPERMSMKDRGHDRWERGDRDGRRDMMGRGGMKGGRPGCGCSMMNRDRGMMGMGGMGMGMMGRGGMGPGQGMAKMWNNVPDDIRAKMVDLAKLRIDMQDALTRNPVDRAKATEVYGKMAALKQDIGTWRFNRKLDNMERRQKEMELNRNVPAGAPVSGDKTNP